VASEPEASISTPRPRSPLATVLRFKWALFSAVVIFVAVYWIDAVLAHHGLRRDATLLDNLLLSGLVLALGIAQQLRHERQLKRHRQLMSLIADMNHHTRNALQVIVSRSALSIADSEAIADIQQAVRRIDWCLREILPNAGEASAGQSPQSESGPGAAWNGLGDQVRERNSRL
jgi:signal transduction histidine kinase